MLPQQLAGMLASIGAGRSMRAGRPNAAAMRSQLPWLTPPMSIQPSLPL
jgi:hypothetical protein